MNGERYKPYTAKRWTEIPMPKAVEGAACKEYTPEEKAQNNRDMERIMKKLDILKPDERIENGKVVKL